MPAADAHSHSAPRPLLAAVVGMACTLSVRVPYFSPVSGDTGGGRAGSGSELGTGSGHGPGAPAQQCHAGPGRSCRDVLGRRPRSRRRICGALANPPGGVGKDGAASLAPEGWAGSGDNLGRDGVAGGGEVEGEVAGPGTGRPAGRAHVSPAPTGDGQPQSPGKFHGGLGRHPGAQAGLQPEGLGQVGNGHCLLVVAGQGDRGQRAGSASCWTRMVSGALGTIFGPSEPQFAHLETGSGAATPRGSCDIETGHS